MSGIRGSEDRFRVFGMVPLEDLLDGQDRQQVILWSAQSNIIIDPDSRQFTNRKYYRNRKQCPVSQPHCFEYAPIVCRGHERIKRRKRASREHLQITKFSLRNSDGWKAISVVEKLCNLKRIRLKVDQFI